MSKAVSAQVRPELVDHLIELYCDWRTGCADVQASYERFSRASTCERAAAFEAYAAALDREEAACEAYAAQIGVVESDCAQARSRAGRRWLPRR